MRKRFLLILGAFDFFTPFPKPTLVNFQVLSSAIPPRASPNTFYENTPAANVKIEQKIPLKCCSVWLVFSARLCFYFCTVLPWNVMHKNNISLLSWYAIPPSNLEIPKDNLKCVLYTLMHRNRCYGGVQCFLGDRRHILLILACHFHGHWFLSAAQACSRAIGS